MLIDECSKPVVSTFQDEKLCEELQKTLVDFYGMLKSHGGDLKFLMLTSATYLPKVSIFSSGINQLADVSTHDEYASLCGITKDELLQYFTPELKKLAEKQNLSFDEAVAKMMQKYGGYHFRDCDEEGVLNPVSVLNSLNFSDFESYWLQTGTHTYLVDLLKKQDYLFQSLPDKVMAQHHEFTGFREDMLTIPMLYQNGYLTITEYDRRYGCVWYHLGFPNDEVKYGFLDFLMPYYTSLSTDDSRFHIAEFSRELASGNVEALIERLKAFFAKMPCVFKKDRKERYQAIFHMVFMLVGQYADAQVCSGYRDNVDVVVKTEEFIYVFEIKFNGTAEEALQQIDGKNYSIPYQPDGRTLVKIGVEFSKEEHNIHRFIVG